MRAMILAAGLGERMQPLTADRPKPLLKVADKSLIELQIEKLAVAGINDMVINHFYRGAMIEEALGDGSRYGVSIQYSSEPVRLETAGGIVKALPMLKEDCFVVVNSDIYTDFDYSRLPSVDGETRLAHLVLVPTVAHNPDGDFALDPQGLVHKAPVEGLPSYVFSGISVLHRKLFTGLPVQPQPLAPILIDAMSRSLVSGELHAGIWIDVGTPERLAQVQQLQARIEESST
jgi:N-acetyl-alpha-D-muramate 1-phosphate uridylyltransferase